MGFGHRDVSANPSTSTSTSTFPICRNSRDGRLGVLGNALHRHAVRRRRAGGAGAERDRPRYQRTRVRHDRRAERLWEEHVALSCRRLTAPEFGQPLPARAADHGAWAGWWNRLSALFAVSVAYGAQQYRLWARRAGGRARRAESDRRRVRPARAPAGVRGPLSSRTVRRHAAARRARADTRMSAGHPADGRAVRGPRRANAAHFAG